jgi:hypothetical protein
MVRLLEVVYVAGVAKNEGQARLSDDPQTLMEQRRKYRDPALPIVNLVL